MKCLVEAVACSVEDVLLAWKAGADRVELCAAIELGGLTPSIGLAAEAVRACDLPVMAMVRPRAGGFCYSEVEIATMVADTRALIDAGVHGIVFGILDHTGRVSKTGCARLMEAAGDRETVFHRAFDVAHDPRQTLDDLIDAGITRILTSGQRAQALEGAPLILDLRNRAAGRIQIMAGGGVRAANVVEIVGATGADQVHLGPFLRVGTSTGLYSDGWLVLDAAEVADTVKCLASLASPH